MGSLDPWARRRTAYIAPSGEASPMPAPELVAYPTLLAVTYGLYRVGRRGPVSYKDGFEWARACSLVILLGVIVFVQVRLVSAGSVASLVGRAGAAMGIAAALALVVLTFYRMFETRGARSVPRARASSP